MVIPLLRQTAVRGGYLGLSQTKESTPNMGRTSSSTIEEACGEISSHIEVFFAIYHRMKGTEPLLDWGRRANGRGGIYVGSRSRWEDMKRRRTSIGLQEAE